MNLITLFRVHARPKSPTFGTLAERWLASQQGKRWHDEAGRLLRRDLAPLASIQADKLGRLELAALINAIQAPGIANNCLRVVSSVYGWGISTGRIDCANPASGLKKRPLKRIVQFADGFERLRPSPSALKYAIGNRALLLLVGGSNG